jgi:hypothetical protein
VIIGQYDRGLAGHRPHAERLIMTADQALFPPRSLLAGAVGDHLREEVDDARAETRREDQGRKLDVLQGSSLGASMEVERWLE